MTQADWHLLSVLQDWIFAIGVIVPTFVVAPILRAFLRRYKGRGVWDCLHQVSRPVSLLVYPLGLRLAIEFAPLRPKAEEWLQAFAYILSVVFFMNLVQRVAMIAVEMSAMRGGRSSATFQQGFIPLLKNVVTLVVFLVGGIMVLKYFGYDVMSLVTALGVGSLAVGMAAKDTLSNMFAGFVLIIDRNLRAGDKINLGGTVGIVDEIGLRSTRLNTGDGNMLIVPNQDLVNTKILNMSSLGPENACATQFRVPMVVPFARIKAICEEVFSEIAFSLPERGCSVQLASVSEGHQLVSAGFWVADSDKTADALTDFHARLLERLGREEIPLLGA